MHNYTKVFFTIEISKRKLDNSFLYLIRDITQQNINCNYYKAPIKHEFFECPTWKTLLFGDNGLGVTSFIEKKYCFVINIKSSFIDNYNLVSKFLDFITPYVAGRKKSVYIGESLFESNKTTHYIKRVF